MNQICNTTLQQWVNELKEIKSDVDGAFTVSAPADVDSEISDALFDIDNQIDGLVAKIEREIT
jgi:hypothetical protein